MKAILIAMIIAGVIAYTYKTSCYNTLKEYIHEILIGWDYCEEGPRLFAGMVIITPIIALIITI